MEIIDYDGHEWMRGLGFPGWSNARWSIFMTAIAGTPALIGCWQLAHQQRDCLSKFVNGGFQFLVRHINFNDTGPHQK